MNNLLAQAMHLLRRPTTTSAPPLQLRISASAPPLQLRISATAPPTLRIKCSKPSEDKKKPLTAKQKGLLKARRRDLKSFRKRLVKAQKELQNARDLKRKGLPGTRGTPSWKMVKAALTENVMENKAQVERIEKKIQEITKQISELTGGAQ